MFNRILNFLTNAVLSLFVMLGILVILGFLFWENYPKTAEEYVEKVKQYWKPTPQKTKKPLIYRGFGIELPPYQVRGLDVSHYQAQIDWVTLKSMKVGRDSLTFVFIKATEGEDYTDNFFEENWSESKKVGFLQGAYHYYRPNAEPIAQAHHFIKHVPNDKNMLPPVLDIEERGDLDMELLLRNLQTWLDIVQNHYKKTPIIYSNRNFYTYFLKNKFQKKYPVWIAQYKDLNEKPLEETDWVFWQHSAEAQANGIAPKVDLNVFRGSFQELKKLAE